MAVFASCDNELNIIEDYKDIPVVYGVLSSSDTAQYIRVERAFVDPETSALVLAQNPDSIYYPNIEVTIEGENGQVYQLEKVDGNLEGYIREEGAFAQSPNYLYKIRSNEIALIAGNEYTLNLQRPGNNEAVTATTSLVGTSQILTPKSSIGFNYVQPTKVRWRKGANARIFDIYIQLNYRERITNSSDDFEKKLITWKMASNIPSTSDEIEEFEKVGIDFYSFLAGNIEANEAIERRADDVTIILDSGGVEILELNRLNNANLGITSSQDIPVYTNLSEGRGIFSSKYSEKLNGIELKASTMDSLVNGVITHKLNFKL